MDDLETKRLELDAALRNREFEIQLFWQRSNYFLVLITALGVGFFSIEPQAYKVALSFFGTLASYLWYNTNLGSRFWQVFWEHEVELLSTEAGIRSFQKVTPEIKKELRTAASHSDKKLFWRKWIDDAVIEQKPSVTMNMIYLSIWATILWWVLFLTNFYELIRMGI